MNTFFYNFVHLHSFSHKNKPTSSAPRLKFLYNSANNPTTKIGMGTHHPTIAFVTFYPVASRNNKLTIHQYIVSYWCFIKTRAC